MKRFVCFVLLSALLLSGGVRAQALEPLGDDALPIAAPAAILMEKSTGTVLYEKNAEERLPPASVTKVMTLLLLMEDIDAGRLSVEDTVTASERAASFGGSCVYLEPGEKMSVHEMLKCIAVASANDCAVAMAEHVCGTEAVFVERMNRRAAELGLKNTHFTNCTGLFEDAEHYTSARDIAIMSRELLLHPLIKEYTTIWMDSIRGGSFELANTNKLVHWYEGCTGLKTGYTAAAKYCLSASAERNGVEFIAVVLHGETSESRNADATSLLNYAFANFSLASLRPEGALPGLPVELGAQERVSLRCEGEEHMLLPKGSGELSYALELPGSVASPVEEGQRLGTLRVHLGEELLAELPLTAAETVPRLGFWSILGKLAGSLVGL